MSKTVSFRNFNPKNLKVTKIENKKVEETEKGGKGSKDKKKVIEYYIPTLEYNIEGPGRGKEVDNNSEAKKRFEKFRLEVCESLIPRGLQENGFQGKEAFQMFIQFTPDLDKRDREGEPIIKDKEELLKEQEKLQEDIDLLMEVFKEIRETTLYLLCERYSELGFKKKTDMDYESLVKTSKQLGTIFIPEAEDGKSPTMFSNFYYFKGKGKGNATYAKFTELRKKNGKVVENTLKLNYLFSQRICGKPVLDMSRIYVGNDKIRHQHSIISCFITNRRKATENNFQENTIKEYKEKVNIDELEELDEDEDAKNISRNLDDFMKPNEEESDETDEKVSSESGDKQQGKRKKVIHDVSTDEEQDEETEKEKTKKNKKNKKNSSDEKVDKKKKGKERIIVTSSSEDEKPNKNKKNKK